jgi:anion-transporting  ArsA/GET3 family ATPase
VLGRGSGVALSVLKRATGIDLLEDLSTFFSSFGDMADGFRERAEHVNALLADSRSAFVLVTSPRAPAMAEAGWFHHRLLDAGLPFAGVVANRVHPPAPRGDPSAELEQLLDDEALAGKVLRTFEQQRRLAAQDRRNLADLRRRLGRTPMIEVPHLDDDVHDLDGLRRVDEYLFG